MQGGGKWFVQPSGMLRKVSLECAMEVLHSNNLLTDDLFKARSARQTARRNCANFSVHVLTRCAAIVLPLVLFSSVGHGRSQVTIEYQYDELNRLARVVRDTEMASVRYHYDEVSNIEWVASAASPDSDGDDIPNFADTDDDNDGIPDAVEIAAGLNALDAAGLMGAMGDFDNDGISNIEEYLQGSDINHFHGDLDSDNDLDLGDVVVMKRIIFGQQEATQEQGESGHGDVNMDGNLDVGDLVILRRLYFE
ncbi:Uncharacterised protein [Halioglobus japonicus]|nr:Uncharacterised protein [Halioglobus japonicus]